MSIKLGRTITAIAAMRERMESVVQALPNPCPILVHFVSRGALTLPKPCRWKGRLKAARSMSKSVPRAPKCCKGRTGSVPPASVGLPMFATAPLTYRFGPTAAYKYYVTAVPRSIRCGAVAAGASSWPDIPILSQSRSRKPPSIPAAPIVASIANEAVGRG